MKTIFSVSLVSMLVIAYSPLFSQKQGKDRVDSLIIMLKQHPSDDSVKVDLYRKICFEYYSIDPKTGIEYGEKGAALAGKINYGKGHVACLISIGVCYWASSDFPKSLEILFKALKMSEDMGYKTGIDKASLNIGLVYADEKNYLKALEYYDKALKISMELKDTIGIARKLGNMGTIYQQMMPLGYLKALEYYRQSLKYYEIVHEKRGIAVTMQNISRIFSERSEYSKAIELLNKARPIVEEIGESRWIMYYYGTIGSIYYKRATDTSMIYRPTLNLLTKKQKDEYLSLSIGYLVKAIEIGKEINATMQVIEWYDEISSSLCEMGKWESAYYYADSSRRLNDSLFNQESRIRIANLDAKRETEVKQKEIELQKALLDKANVQRIAAIGGIIGLIIIILVIYQSGKRSERLLRNMLPAKIARRLKKREKHIADLLEDAAVVFIDIVDFTSFAKDKDPRYVIEVLTDFFETLDELSEEFGMEKIKTIGDSYMAVSGVPEPTPDSVLNAARFALKCRELMKNYTTRDGQRINVRIGIDTGSVIAGVIGEKRFSYDLWGDIVNTASRMESLGVKGEIQITGNVMKKLGGLFNMEERGEIEVKGKGKMKTWLLVG
jgi:adenylate cyclase